MVEFPVIIFIFSQNMVGFLQVLEMSWIKFSLFFIIFVN